MKAEQKIENRKQGRQDNTKKKASMAASDPKSQNLRSGSPSQNGSLRLRLRP
jgi:hypothetical protein